MEEEGELEEVDNNGNSCDHYPEDEEQDASTNADSDGEEVDEEENKCHKNVLAMQQKCTLITKFNEWTKTFSILAASKPDGRERKVPVLDSLHPSPLKSWKKVFQLPKIQAWSQSH